MKFSITTVALAALFVAIAAAAAPSYAAAASDPDLGQKGRVILLETEGSTGISVRIAEELGKVVSSRSGKRLLPLIGTGSLQNIIDLKDLHGIDVAILQKDVLDYAKQKNLVPHIESSMSYVTSLYTEEFHLLARPEIKSISDLANQKISVDVYGAGTAITTARLFDLLGIPVSTTNEDPKEGIEKLRRNEVTAVALVAGKPAPVFCDLIGENGLHFLSIPADAAIGAGYVPARITAGDYPGLVPYNQPVDTVAVGTLLAVTDVQPGSDRYRNIGNFVDAFFGGFQSLLQPGNHPKWHEVNIMTELPNWRRFPPAAHWLRLNTHVAAPPDIERLKANFSRFIDEHQQDSGNPPLSQQEKDKLFDQFKHWASERPELWQSLEAQ
jgi:TRAP transporter TAXI family solute receptor